MMTLLACCVQLSADASYGTAILCRIGRFISRRVDAASLADV